MSVRWHLVAVKVKWVVLLRPLSGKNGGYEFHQQKQKNVRLLSIPFKNFLLAYFLKNASWTTGWAR